MNRVIALGVFLAGAVLVSLGFAWRPAPPGGAAGAAWNVPDINTLPNDTWGRTVRAGHDLIAHTSALIGPRASDPALRFAGNDLDCQSCHIAAGTRQFGLPLVGVFADFPNYRAREGRVGTIEDRINGCLTRSLNGKPLPLGSPQMVAMVAYLKFLSGGRTVGEKTFGRGAGKMDELKRAADPLHGRAVFARTCAVCHGENGQGQRAPGGAGYQFPPLWGADSFNDGAGMARLGTAANFIRSNMPHGTSWRTPVVAPDDAWDVAAYVISQPRPHKAGLDADYPKRSEKPADTPYGPYADGFSQQQHRLGPFGPIRKASGKD